jgi:hypothetical protein
MARYDYGERCPGRVATDNIQLVAVCQLSTPVITIATHFKLVKRAPHRETLLLLKTRITQHHYLFVYPFGSPSVIFGLCTSLPPLSQPPSPVPPHHQTIANNIQSQSQSQSHNNHHHDPIFSAHAHRGSNSMFNLEKAKAEVAEMLQTRGF